MIFWTRLSVAVSTEAVASSSTNIRACFSNARPKETSCLCPTLQLSPFSDTENQTLLAENKKSYHNLKMRRTIKYYQLFPAFGPFA